MLLDKSLPGLSGVRVTFNSGRKCGHASQSLLKAAVSRRHDPALIWSPSSSQAMLMLA